MDMAMGLLLRFARLTPQSSSVLTLLHSITRQASLLLTGRLPQTPHVSSDPSVSSLSLGSQITFFITPFKAGV